MSNTELREMKQEATTPDGIERTSTRTVFVPRADIYESGDNIVVMADIPGADENSIDITLEKNILTIRAFVEDRPPENHSLTYAEYRVGDYQRIFTLSNEVDRDGIQASVKNGVLRLTLPKSQQAKIKKIAVTAN